MVDFVSIATEAALAGGEVLRARAGTIRDIRTKTTATDLVTEADVESGVAVVRAITARLPHGRIVVEEPEVYALVGVEPGSIHDPEVWIIDPLDGTTSFVHGYPCYSVAVALVRDGRPVASAVYDAAHGTMSSAALGVGAERDGRPLAVSEARDIGEALLITGFPYDRGRTLDRQLAVLAHVLRRVQGIRRDGSAELDLCHVAAGTADGFWEFALNPWDMAAGALIASEAGALVTDMSGRPWTVDTTDVVAANPRLHVHLLDAIAAGLAEGGFAQP